MSNPPLPLHGQLTRFKPGSFLEFSWISIPLVLSMLSRGLMLFVDRFVVAKYSSHSLNALTAAGTNVAVVLFAIFGIAGISQVFAGQYNGAGEYKKVARPVWQMIWFSFMANAITIPLAFIAPKYILAPLVYEEGTIYFQWCMFIIFQSGMNYALGAFFSAIGKTYYVTYGAIIANLINLMLAIVFVLGVEGVIPAMGIKGAAFAQIIAELLEVIYLMTLFLRKENREKYDTHNWTFDVKLFWNCLRIGVPTCISHVFELSAWSIIIYILGTVGFVHMTVYSIFQSVFILFAHIVSGMEKGLSTLTANAIGAKEFKRIAVSFFQSLKMLALFSTILMLPIVLSPNLLTEQFLCDIDPLLMKQIQDAIIASLIWVLIYTFFDGVGWLIAGVLTAAGDTKFTMFVNVGNVWGFAVLPVYVAAHFGILEPTYTWMIQSGYVFMNLIILYWRYKSNAWRKIHII